MEALEVLGDIVPGTAAGSVPVGLPDLATMAPSTDNTVLLNQIKMIAGKIKGENSVEAAKNIAQLLTMTEQLAAQGSSLSSIDDIFNMAYGGANVARFLLGETDMITRLYNAYNAVNSAYYRLMSTYRRVYALGREVDNQAVSYSIYNASLILEDCESYIKMLKALFRSKGYSAGDITRMVEDMTDDLMKKLDKLDKENTRALNEYIGRYEMDGMLAAIDDSYPSITLPSGTRRSGSATSAADVEEASFRDMQRDIESVITDEDEQAVRDFSRDVVTATDKAFSLAKLITLLLAAMFFGIAFYKKSIGEMGSRDTLIKVAVGLVFMLLLIEIAHAVLPMFTTSL